MKKNLNEGAVCGSCGCKIEGETPHYLKTLIKRCHLTDIEFICSHCSLTGHIALENKTKIFSRFQITIIRMAEISINNYFMLRSMGKDKEAEKYEILAHNTVGGYAETGLFTSMEEQLIMHCLHNGTDCF